MRRKILFFDVDGTLVTNGNVIADSTRRALTAAREAGHVLIVNTGRPYRHVVEEVKALPMSGFICSLSGLIRMGGEVLCHYTFTPEESREIRDAGYGCGMDMLFESEEAVWLDSRALTPIGRREIRWLDSIGVPARTDTFAPDFAFDKFVCWPREGADPDRFETLFRDRLEIVHREHSMRECVRKGLSKSLGMDRIAHRLGIPKEDTFAFGDSANDLSMLRAAGTGVVMGNAPPEVCAEADYVTGTAENDGLYDAMRHFGLI